MTGGLNVRALLGLAVVATLAWLVYLDRLAGGDDAGSNVVQAQRREAGDGTVAQRQRAAGYQHPLAGLDPAHLHATVARPLFEPNRRPHESPRPPPVVQRSSLAPAPKAALPEPSYRLIGIVLGSGRSIALLGKGDGKPLRVEQGDQVDGWTVAQIDAAEVTLTLGDRRLQIRMPRR